MVDDGEHRTLHFEESQIQSLMACDDPDRLVVPYTRSMAAFVLFVPTPAHITMIGLGGGSLVKYCLKHLPASVVTAVEIAASVVALRDRFGVPPDGPRLSVVVQDGADYVRAHPRAADVLLVDGFDGGGLAPTLATPAFYAHCREHLRQGGVMVANLNLDTDGHSVSIRRIRDAFAGELAVITSEDQANKVIFASRGPLPDPELLRLRAEQLDASHPLDLPQVAALVEENLRHRPQERRRPPPRLG